MQLPPIPPFTRDAAIVKVQAAADEWTTRDPKRVALLCAPDCVWRYRQDLFQGRAAIEFFLSQKWTSQAHYRLKKELWAFTENRISVRFECEWRHASFNQWYRTLGNEHWEFNADGYMTRRDMSANDSPISAAERSQRKSTIEN